MSEVLAAVVVDTTPDELRSWGLSSRPLRMAPNEWQPVVSSLRDANTGRTPVASVQPIIDATFPGKGYTAAALTIASVPKGTFTYTPPPGTPGDGKRDFTSSDNGLKLPFELYQWDFGDGVRTAGGKVTHTYARRGNYTVVHTVAVGGQVWQSRQVVKPWGGPLPQVTSLDPPVAAIGGPDLDLHVYGNGFVFGSTHILFNETEQPTLYVSDTEATTTIKPSTATVPGSFPIAVAIDGLGRSNAVGFDYVPGTGPVPAPAGGQSKAESQEVEFDPADHTVDDVVAYADEHPDELDRLIGEEEAGKARVTLLEKLHAREP